MPLKIYKKCNLVKEPPRRVLGGGGRGDDGDV